jgi:hypothetical protein
VHHAPDRGEYLEAAGAVAKVLNKPETKRKKAAKAALVFEDWNGPTSSQRTVPVKRLKHIKAVETHLPRYRARQTKGQFASAKHARMVNS